MASTVERATSTAAVALVSIGLVLPAEARADDGGGAYDVPAAQALVWPLPHGMTLVIRGPDNVCSCARSPSGWTRPYPESRSSPACQCRLQKRSSSPSSRSTTPPASSRLHHSQPAAPGRTPAPPPSP